MFNRVRRTAVASLLATLLCGACTTWQVQGAAPAQVITERQPKVIRLRERDGTVRDLWRPRIENDTLRGSVPGSADPGLPLLEAAVPLDQIESMAAPRLSLVRLVALIVAAPVIVLSSYFIMVQ